MASQAKGKRRAVSKRSGFPVISLRQPWADLVVDGVKDVENRGWRTHLRGRILIHAAQIIDWRAVKESLKDLRLVSMDDYDPQTGAIIGMVELVDCVDEHRSRFFTGPHGFVLRNAVRFRRPVPYSGKTMIFRAPLSKLRGTSAVKAKPGEFVRGMLRRP